MYVSYFLCTFAAENQVNLLSAFEILFTHMKNLIHRALAAEKNLLLYLLFPTLLLSCGVKKHAAETSAVAAEPVAETAPADTLPGFLKEFANDSTIHINWAYGIPFIIDDSVPMLLPPIDKNPQGYVCSRDFILHYPYTNFFINSEVASIVDSLPWLNKCVNEIYMFLQPNVKDEFSGHKYGCIIYQYNIKQNDALVLIKIIQTPYWTCTCNMSCEQEVNYFFDYSGNLIGKCLTSNARCRKGAKVLSRNTNYYKFTTSFFTNDVQCNKLVGIGFYSINDDCCRTN